MNKLVTIVLVFLLNACSSTPNFEEKQKGISDPKSEVGSVEESRKPASLPTVEDNSHLTSTPKELDSRILKNLLTSALNKKKFLTYQQMVELFSNNDDLFPSFEGEGKYLLQMAYLSLALKSNNSAESSLEWYFKLGEKLDMSEVYKLSSHSCYHGQFNLIHYMADNHNLFSLLYKSQVETLTDFCAKYGASSITLDKIR